MPENRIEAGFLVDEFSRQIITANEPVGENGGVPIDATGAMTISPQSTIIGSGGPGGGGTVDQSARNDIAAHKVDPSAHNLPGQLDTRQAVSEKGLANGYAGLDATGKVPSSQLPATAGTPDATTIQKGTIKLAQDLGGTADLPTVPGLLLKLSIASNLSDVANAGTARTNLGLGSSATRNVAGSGDAGTADVVKGDDTRLTNSRVPLTHTHPTSEVTGLEAQLGLKAPLASPSLTGTPLAPTAAPDTTGNQIASLAFVAGQASSANPLPNGTATPGVGTRWSRADHVHPTDTTRAPNTVETSAGYSNLGASSVLTLLDSPQRIRGTLNVDHVMTVNGLALGRTAEVLVKQDVTGGHLLTITDGTTPQTVAVNLGTLALTSVLIRTNGTTLDVVSTAGGGGGGSAPTGAAGGDLASTYPNPTIKASVALTGTPTVPTAAANTNTTQAASTAFVVGQAGTTTPAVDGTAAVGSSLRYARDDHVHPTDTSRAAVASPAFSGTPNAPTPAAGTNTTQLATTEFVRAAMSQGITPGTVTTASSAPALTGRSRTVWAATLGAHHDLAPTGMMAGAELTIEATQNGLGNWLLLLNGVDLRVDPRPNKTSIVQVIWDGSNWLEPGLDPAVHTADIPRRNKYRTWAYPPRETTGAGQAMANNVGIFHTMEWPATDDLSTIDFFVGVAAVANATCNVVLYSLLGTRLGIADITTAIQSVGPKSITLTPDGTGLTAIPGYPGQRLVVGVHSITAGTTPAQLRIANGFGNMGLAKTDVYQAFIKAMTSLPTTGVSFSTDTGGVITGGFSGAAAAVQSVWFGAK